MNVATDFLSVIIYLFDWCMIYAALKNKFLLCAGIDLTATLVFIGDLGLFKNISLT